MPEPEQKETTMDAPIDQASLARHGGRLITQRVAAIVDDISQGKLKPRVREALGGLLGPEELGNVWHYHIDPAGMQGRKSWTEEAGFRTGSYRFDPAVKAVSLAQAEEMASWPIIAAAYQPLPATETLDDGDPYPDPLNRPEEYDDDITECPQCGADIDASNPSFEHECFADATETEREAERRNESFLAGEDR
jgi:hypothetical protein